MNNKKQLRLVAILFAAIVVADQVIKLIVKTNMQLGEQINVLGTWFRIYFIENQGIAFGLFFGGNIAKVMLTIFRLLASCAIGWFVVRLVRKGARLSLVLPLTLIIAGAVGNVIDSCFYGLIFSSSNYSVATLFPPEGGYAPFLQGRVVDMFYFPLFEFDWPQWLPLLGGKHFEFFDAIFNLADASITIGIVWLLIDQLFLAQKAKK